MAADANPTRPSSDAVSTGALVLDRFEVVRCLGSGAMGVVYEVLDRRRGWSLALKSLSRLTPAGVLQFKREFRALRGVLHPNLVRLDALFAEKDDWFFTMELIPGTDLFGYVDGTRPDGSPQTWRKRPGGAELGSDSDPQRNLGMPSPPAQRGQVLSDLGRLRLALRQVASGLNALHATGKVHQDVKPSNVLVTHQARVVLVDFGLVTDIASDTLTDAQRQGLVGTVPYMAPEQAAGATVSSAADWYAVGVVIYEALTCQWPFAGSALQLLAAKATFDPLPPSTLVDGIPSDLERLCMDLLARDPSRRPSGEDVLRRLAAPSPGDSGWFFVPPAARHDTCPFVGRQRELREIDDAYRRVRGGETVVLCVAGESGVGKSALARHVSETLVWDDPGVQVFRGACYEQESIPFKAFDGLVDDMVSMLRRLDARSIGELLPDANDAALLARVLPALGRVPAIAAAVPLRRVESNARETRARAFAAMRGLLKRLSARGPLVLCIDDMQWADGDSLLLLRDLLDGEGAPAMLVLATWRSASDSPEGAGAAALATLPGPVQVMELHSLPPPEAADLARRLWETSGVGEFDAESLASEARGHPLFIQEMVHYLVSGQGLARDRMTLDQVIRERALAVPADARRLLECIVVAPRPVPVAVAAHAAGLDASMAEFWIAQLIARNLIRGGAVRDVVSSYHDRVRAAIDATIDPPVRRFLHGKLAEALRVLGGQSPDLEALVHHLELAGENERAADAAEQAGKLASRQLAFERAAVFFEKAISLGTHDHERRKQLDIDLACALRDAGHGTRSAEVFLRAAEGAEPHTRMDCLQQASVQLLVAGHVLRGVDTLAIVISAAGAALPRSRWRALAAVLWERLLLRVGGIRVRRRDSFEISPAELARIDAVDMVGRGLGLVDPLRGSAFQAQALRLALRAGEPTRLAPALALEAVYRAIAGPRAFAAGERLMTLAFSAIKGQKDAKARATMLGSLGLFRYLQGRFTEAHQLLEKAEHKLRRLPRWPTIELNVSRTFHLLALRFTGRFAELARRADACALDAERREDRFLATTTARAFNIVWLVRDQPERARQVLLTAAWSPPEKGLHLQHWYEVRALAEIALYTGHCADAYDELMPRIRRVLDSSLSFVQTTRAEALWLEARLAIATAEAGQRAAKLATARKNARRLASFGLPYQASWAHLLHAGVAALDAQHAAAAESLRAAISSSSEAKMMACEACAMIGLGELLDGDDGHGLAARGAAALESEGVRDTEAFCRLILPGMPPRKRS